MVDVLDKFRGSLIGAFLGDSLGKEVEGKRKVDEEYTERMRSPGYKWDGDYTDDTEMMIGLCEALIEGGFNPKRIAERFVENYHPFRGYGRGARKVIRLLKQGTRWDDAGKLSFPGGSYGNGAAMRIAPLGLLYFEDEDKLVKNAILSSIITHYHPLGVEGGVLMAYSIAMAVKKDPRTFIPGDFLDVLIEKEPYLRKKVYEYTYEYGGEDREIYLFSLKRAKSYILGGHPSLKTVKRQLGTSSKAHRSVVTSIYLFLKHFGKPFDAIMDAIAMGGDTDTIASMSGALGGALGGISVFPPEKIAQLTDEGKGKTYVLSLSEALYRKLREGV